MKKISIINKTIYKRILYFRIFQTQFFIIIENNNNTKTKILKY